VTSKKNLKKNFCWHLEGHGRKERDLDPLIRVTDPRIRIQILAGISWIWCTTWLAVVLLKIVDLWAPMILFIEDEIRLYLLPVTCADHADVVTAKSADKKYYRC
jgi:hypothetical protein